MSALVRHVAAVAVIAIGCPAALHLGVNISCAQAEMSPQCADAGLLLSPVILALTGVVCAFLVRGLLGFALGAVGIFLGMLILWVDMALGGDPIPFDIAQGAIATIWFGLPSVIGYSLTRAAMWTFRRVVPA